MGRAPVRDALLLVCRPRAARAIGARASLIVRGAKWSLDSHSRGQSLPQSLPPENGACGGAASKPFLATRNSFWNVVLASPAGARQAVAIAGGATIEVR